MSRVTTIILVSLVALYSCEGMPGGDARKNPQIKRKGEKNLEEGRGFRLDSAFGKSAKGGVFHLQVQMNSGGF